MKFDLKYMTTGVIIGCVGLTTVLAAPKIKKVVENNFGLVFEGYEASQTNKMLSVQFEGSSSAIAYVNMHDFLNDLNLQGEYDEAKKAFVIVDSGWAKNSTPLKTATSVATPKPIPTKEPDIVAFPEMYPTSTPIPVVTSAPKTTKKPDIDENGYYNLEYDYNNVYDDFINEYLKNMSFELNELGVNHSSYNFSFYDGNIVKLYKEEFSGAKSILIGSYEATSYQVNIEWDKVIYLDDNNVIKNMATVNSSTEFRFKIKANSPDVYFSFIDENDEELPGLFYKKIKLKEYYKTK